MADKHGTLLIMVMSVINHIVLLTIMTVLKWPASFKLVKMEIQSGADFMLE